jgi:hypothetical protein
VLEFELKGPQVVAKDLMMENYEAVASGSEDSRCFDFGAD